MNKIITEERYQQIRKWQKAHPEKNREYNLNTWKNRYLKEMNRLGIQVTVSEEEFTEQVKQYRSRETSRRSKENLRILRELEKKHPRDFKKISESIQLQNGR